MHDQREDRFNRLGSQWQCGREKSNDKTEVRSKRSKDGTLISMSITGEVHTGETISQV